MVETAVVINNKVIMHFIDAFMFHKIFNLEKEMTIKQKIVTGTGFVAAVATVIFYYYGRSIWVPYYQQIVGLETVASITDKYGESAESRLRPYFKKAEISYPPKGIKLLAMKEERVLELWATDSDENGYHKIRDYTVRGASGRKGPKLREGDRQVPEGIYRITGLNPNSSYHLSMKLDYPNEFDLFYARKEGRSRPGSNIFIHGKSLSVGCLAIGDKAIEELFMVVQRVGFNNAEVIIAPHDPRYKPLSVDENDPEWLAVLYREISDIFGKFRENRI